MVFFRKSRVFIFALFIILSSLLIVMQSCVPQRPNPTADDIYSWKMEILNSPKNVLVKQISGVLVHVSGSDGIIHDGKTGIYVYKGNFYSSDKDKKVTLTNVTGTLYKDSIQIDFSKGGTKSLSTSSENISPANLNTVLTKSDKDRALWDQRYVLAYGYIKKGITQTGDIIFSYETTSGTSQIPISISPSILTTPLNYDTEATLTGFTQFINGGWKLNVVSAEIGKTIVGDGIFVDEVVDGTTFKSLGNTYKLIGLDVSLSENPKADLENFIVQNDSFVQIQQKKTVEGETYVFLYSSDGKKFYQEEVLKNGKARPDFDASIDDNQTYEILKDAYKQAYDKKSGVYSLFSTATIVSTNTAAESNLNKFVIVSGTVKNVIKDTNGNWEINVDDWLKVVVKAGNYKYLFSRELNILKDKLANFFGYLTKPEGSSSYLMELKAEWEYFSFAGGSGTQDDPFLIETPLQLFSVRALATQNKYFKLKADIDLTGYSWTPIGTYSSNLSQSAFQGVFDGNGYKIKNITFNDTSASNVGLFGYIYKSTIKNLVIENASMIANQRVGVLAGASKDSTIEQVKVINSSVRAEIDGSCYTGGLIGDATDGTKVKQCVVLNTTVSGKKYAVGGLIGQLKGTTTKPVLVENSYVQGGEVKSDYSSTTASAGFICNYTIPTGGGEVKNNYAAIKVTNGQGFVGYIVTAGNDQGASNNYFDKDVAGTSNDKLAGKGVTAKTTSEMKQKNTFNGWDFDNIWKIDEGTDYPRLNWE